MMRFSEFSQMNFQFIPDFFNWVRYNLMYWLFYLLSVPTVCNTDNYSSFLTGMAALIKEADIINSNNNQKKFISYEDDNAVSLRWSKKMYRTFENDIELPNLLRNMWVLDMSYDDDGGFVKYCAKKYSHLKFVYFAKTAEIYDEMTGNPQHNVHVFFMTPSIFVNRENKTYEDFVIKNRVGYRRVFASQGLEYCYNFQALFEHIDKCLYKEYGNTIKSYFLAYRVTCSGMTKYLPVPTPEYKIYPIHYMGFFRDHLNPVSYRKVNYYDESYCYDEFKHAIEHISASQRAVLSAFYDADAIFVSKHVFHPVNDFYPN